MNVIVKVMQNRLGQWAVYYGSNGLATKLAYHRFFKTKEVAEKWAIKFINKK